MVPSWAEGDLGSQEEEHPRALRGSVRQDGFNPLVATQEIQRTFNPDEPNDHLVASPSFTLRRQKLIPEYQRVFERDLKLAKFVSDPVMCLKFTQEGLVKLTGQPRGQITIRFGYARNSHSLESATYKSAVCDEAGAAGLQGVVGRSHRPTPPRLQGAQTDNDDPIRVGMAETTLPRRRYRRVGQGGPRSVLHLGQPEHDPEEIARQKEILPGGSSSCSTKASSPARRRDLRLLRRLRTS